MIIAIDTHDKPLLALTLAKHTHTETLVSQFAVPQPIRSDCSAPAIFCLFERSSGPVIGESIGYRATAPHFTIDPLLIPLIALSISSLLFSISSSQCHSLSPSLPMLSLFTSSPSPGVCFSSHLRLSLNVISFN